MTKARRALALVTLPILALGASVYVNLLSQARRFTVLDHAFRLAVPVQGVDEALEILRARCTGDIWEVEGTRRGHGSNI